MARSEIALVLEFKNQLSDREVVSKCGLAPVESCGLIKAVVGAFMMRPRHCAARATAGEPGQVFLAGAAKAASLGLALTTEEAGPFDGPQQTAKQVLIPSNKVTSHHYRSCAFDAWVRR